MRDDFKQQIKDILAKRVAYICSNPDCNANTIGPNSDESKSTNVGVASHICAAAEGGPRYDKKMSSIERSSINNGIWLCQNCSKMIDTDENLFTVELLKKWKNEAELRAKNSLGKYRESLETVGIQSKSLDSNLVKIITILSRENFNDSNSQIPNSFQIEKKISYNNLCSSKSTINLYSAYHYILSRIYNEFDQNGSNKSLSVINKIRKEYFLLKSLPDITADDIFNTVIDNLKTYVMRTTTLNIAEEELDMCISVVVVDAFIRCSIFDNPEGYINVASL